MTDRVCPTCMGEGVVEIDTEEVDEETGEVVELPRTRACPICGGEGIVEE